MPVGFVQNGRLIGNLQNVRKRFMATPNVSGLDARNDRVGAGEVVVVERIRADERVDI